MSLAHEEYLPSGPQPLSTSVMDLNNLLHTRQGFERYPAPVDGSQQPRQSPQVQLPAQATTNGDPQVVSTIHEGRLYSLDIVQQPVRARMCGFGDKDRRPITPPPCIRLIVQDANTKQEIDINDIDTSYFVLSVDLWSGDASKEVNLVRHSSTSPSISAATSASYPPNTTSTGNYPQEAAPQYGNMYQQNPISPHHYQQGMVSMGMHQQPLYATHYGPNAYPKQSELAQYQQAYKQQELQHHQHQQHQHQHQQQQQQQQNSHHHHLPSSQPPPSLPPPQSMPDQTRGYYSFGPSPATPTTQMGHYSQQGPLLSPDQLPASTDPRAQPGGMFTRNLIGSLCVSAFKLTDPDNNIGVWFVLQDLSVRTEGTFRLKLSFVNVGQTPTSAPNTPSSSQQNFGPSHQQQQPQLSNGQSVPTAPQGASAAAATASAMSMTSPSSYANANAGVSVPTGVGKLNTGSAPVLASCLSDVFEVFSAKKFPGVIESTRLSKCFATQGIKIPIRKDGVRGNERGGRNGDDDDD